MGVQDDIIEVVNFSGGSLRLSQLKSAFANHFGRPLGEPLHLKLKDWLTRPSFSRLDVYQFGADIFVREKTVGTSSKQRTGATTTVKNPRPSETCVSSPSPPTARSDDESEEERGEDIAAKIFDLLGGSYSATKLHQDSKSLLDLLPLEWGDALNMIGMERVSDISLDVGRRPYCWHSYSRVFLSADPTVKVQDFDIDAITANLQDFGNDNRAGIRGLIGGLETTTLGDVEAKDRQKKTGSKTLEKTLTTRAAAPIFEVIIELKRGRVNEWHVVSDSAKAVDAILRGEKYQVQKRMRCVNSGRIFVEMFQN